MTAEVSNAEDLIRRLLKCTPVREGEAGAPPEASSEEILFDLEIDGSRYLFIRLPKTNQLPVALSPREREIVRLVALGHSNKIIADVLNISSWTVCTHMRRIFAKLGVGSRAAMVAHLTKIGRTGIAERTGSKGTADTRLPVRSSGPISRGDNLRRVCV